MGWNFAPYNEYGSRAERLDALDGDVKAASKAFRNSKGDKDIKKAAKALADAKDRRNSARKDYC